MNQNTQEKPFDLGLGLDRTHVLVTGGCGLIGRVVVEACLAAGCQVTVLDIADTDPWGGQKDDLIYYQCDIADSKAMSEVFEQAQYHFGHVQTCVALASLDLSVLKQTESLADADPRDWQRVFDVNINGTFNTAQQWLRSVRRGAADPHWMPAENVGLIIVGSVCGRFGERGMAAYAAGKSAVQYGLLQSLALDAPRIYSRARVNAIAPGVVNTSRYRQEVQQFGNEYHWKECQATTPQARAVPPEDIARSILFLASERYSGSVHGQLLPVDGGTSGRVAWTRDEVRERGL